MEKIGELIKKAREIKSLNDGKKYKQIDLAKDIGKSRGAIGDLEIGRYMPSYDTIMSIAKACGVPLNFFNIGEENEKSYEDEEMIIYVRKAKNAGVSPDDIKKMLDFLIEQRKRAD